MVFQNLFNNNYIYNQLAGVGEVEGKEKKKKLERKGGDRGKVCRHISLPI